MKFESEQKRNYWITYGARILLEYVIIYALLKLFASEYDKESKFSEAFFGLLILWGVEIALGLKNALIGYVMYKWRGKQITIEALLSNFERLSLPKPNDFYSDGLSYIDDVLSDETASQEAKNFVSGVAAVIGTYESNQMMLRAGMYQTSLEEAIKQYRNTFRD